MIQIKDLKKDVYYVHRNNSIFKYGINQADYYIPSSRKGFGKNCPYDGALRLATKQEKQWLDLCIKHNKFMPEPKHIKSYELW